MTTRTPTPGSHGRNRRVPGPWISASLPNRPPWPPVRSRPGPRGLMLTNEARSREGHPPTLRRRTCRGQMSPPNCSRLSRIPCHRSGTTGQPSESRPRPEFPGASPGHAADIATVAVADRGDEVPVQQELAAEAPVNPADTTDPVRSRKTWEGNPDSSELPQSMKEDLRELGKNLNEIVDPVDWANADIDSRKEMLDAANDRIRQEYGLPQRDVNYRSDLDPDDFGGYDPNTGDIEVNSRVLEDSDPEEAIKTLAHESFHDYQQQAIDGYPGDPYAQARASDWKEAGDNYDPDDAREYWTNQLEIDARAVEEEVYMGYRGV